MASIFSLFAEQHLLCEFILNDRLKDSSKQAFLLCKKKNIVTEVHSHVIEKS